MSDSLLQRKSPKNRFTSPKALEIANQRYQAIKPLLDGEPYDSLDCNISERALRQWKAKYRKAEQEHGVGLVGLISQYKGNPTPRYSDEDLEFIVIDLV